MKFHRPERYVIGVTGPSGAGKSLFCSFYKELGFKVFNCDVVYAKVARRNSHLLKELSRPENFGPDIILENGKLDRKKVASIVFAPDGAEKLELLNSITHKYVLKSIDITIMKYKDKDYKGYVIDAPLLFQSGLDRMCDTTVAILADKELRASRVKIRDRISESEIESRFSAAMPDEWYSSQAAHTFINNGDAAELKRHALALLDGYKD